MRTMSSRDQNSIQTIGKWHLLPLVSGWVLCYLVARNLARLPVILCAQIFRLWLILPQAFRKFPPSIPRFSAESTFTLLANQIWCLGHQFFTEGVKVESHQCWFFRADSTIKKIDTVKTQEKSQNTLPLHTKKPFLMYKYIPKYKNMNRPKLYFPRDVGSQDIGHSLQHCRVWYPNWVIIVKYGLIVVLLKIYIFTIFTEYHTLYRQSC